MRRSVTSLVWMSTRQPLLFASCLLAASCGGADNEEPGAQAPRERTGASEWVVHIDERFKSQCSWERSVHECSFRSLGGVDLRRGS